MRIFLEKLFNFGINIARNGQNVRPTIVVKIRKTRSPLNVACVVKSGKPRSIIKKIAPDTRAYAGCQLFDIWTDQNKPGHVFFYEIWDSRGDQEKYLAWRTETGLMDQLGPFLGAPPVISYFDKFDG